MRLLVLLGLVLSGCVTVESVSAKLDTWVGVEEDALVQQWGPPQRQHENKDGSKVFYYSAQESGVYSIQNNLTDPSKGSTIHSYNGDCAINFKLEDEVVVDTNWRGQVWKCNKEIFESGLAH